MFVSVSVCVTCFFFGNVHESFPAAFRAYTVIPAMKFDFHLWWFLFAFCNVPFTFHLFVNVSVPFHFVTIENVLVVLLHSLFLYPSISGLKPIKTSHDIIICHSLGNRVAVHNLFFPRSVVS